MGNENPLVKMFKAKKEKDKKEQSKSREAERALCEILDGAKAELHALEYMVRKGQGNRESLIVVFSKSALKKEIHVDPIGPDSYKTRLVTKIEGVEMPNPWRPHGLNGALECIANSLKTS